MRKERIVLALGVLLAGCDYTVPLAKSPKLELDRAVVGLWQSTDPDGKVEQLLVLPLNERQYLVGYPSGSRNTMFARGCLWRRGDLTLVQLDWFGTAEGKIPDDKRTFQFLSYRVEGGTLRVRLLNPEVVSRETDSSSALARSIAEHAADPKLFREEMVFHKAGN